MKLIIFICHESKGKQKYMVGHRKLIAKAITYLTRLQLTTTLQINKLLFRYLIILFTKSSVMYHAPIYQTVQMSHKNANKLSITLIFQLLPSSYVTSARTLYCIPSDKTTHWSSVISLYFYPLIHNPFLTYFS